MPLHKYRSVAEIPPPPVREPLDPENLTIACALSTLCIELSRQRLPPGVYKNRSLAEAQERRARWERGAL